MKRLCSSVHCHSNNTQRGGVFATPLSSMLGGVTAESPAAIALIGC